jgi:hypothetical protein
MNSAVRDNLRYIKGLDGVPTIESGLTIDNTDGDERLLLPLLSTAECTSVLNAEGEVAHDEQTHRIKIYDGTAVRSIVSTADVDDTPVDGATTDPISSNYMYDHINLLTTAGDVVYATAAGAWARLGIGSAGDRLRVNAGETAPEWAAGSATQEFFVPYLYGSGGAEAARDSYSAYALDGATDHVHFNFHIPADFTSLTSVKVLIIPVTTGTFDWTVATYFAANGEAYNTHTDSMTADTQAVTNLQVLELDISDAYTGIAVGDNVGTRFTLDALDTTTYLDILGLNIKYA